MHWRVKGAIQRVLGKVPAGERLHFHLQRRLGGLRTLDREIEAKVEDWRLMVGHLRTAGFKVAGTRFFEMGSGWYTTFPFCLYLAGARSVDTCDLNRHLDDELVRAMARALEQHLGMIAEETGATRGEVDVRYKALTKALAHGESVEGATGGVVRYRAPADASKTGLAAGSLDVVFSNSVLEHVPGDVIAACLTESRRILRPQGVIFHSVNCGDHYAYTDSKIHQLNYLKFSDDEWQRWNNAFLYQNRLRAIDFTDLAKAAGFTIEIDTSRPHPKRLEQLDGIKVHPSFARKYSREQLAITSIDFVGRNP